MSELSAADVDEFCDYLEEKGLDETTVESFRHNAMSRATFLLLEEEDLKELVPLIGNRVKVRQLLRALKCETKEVSNF